MALFKRSSSEPIGKFQALQDFTERDFGQMYSIYQKYYENTRYEIFVRDFLKKNRRVFNPASTDQANRRFFDGIKLRHQSRQQSTPCFF